MLVENRIIEINRIIDLRRLRIYRSEHHLMLQSNILIDIDIDEQLII